MAGELSIGAEASDRADLAEQLRRGQDAAARQLEQRWRERRGPLLQLAVEFRDRAGEQTAVADELAGDPHLDVLLAPCQPAPDAIELRRPVEMAGGNGEGRIDLVQVPTQALLPAPALVDE